MAKICATIAALSIAWPLPKAMASVSLNGGVGATAGTLTKADSPLANQGYSYAFYLSWFPEFSKKPSAWMAGVQLKQIKLNYQEDSVNKRATYNLSGGHFGFLLPFSPTFQMHLLGEYYSAANLSILSSNKLLLNATTYKYSSWEELTGKPAAGLRWQFVHDKVDGQFSARNRYRSGLGFSLIQQNFDKEILRITSSNNDLAPDKAYSSAEVSYRLLLINIDIFIGLTF